MIFGNQIVDLQIGSLLDGSHESVIELRMTSLDEYQHLSSLPDLSVYLLAPFVSFRYHGAKRETRGKEKKNMRSRRGKETLLRLTDKINEYLFSDSLTIMAYALQRPSLAYQFILSAKKEINRCLSLSREVRCM
jgi:hypothetical protein